MKKLTAIEFRREIDSLGKVEACRKLNPKCRNEEQAEAFIYAYVMQLLLAGNKVGAAIVLWGTMIFDPRPKCVQRIWRSIEGHAKLLIQGAGSLGKSYNAAIWLLLDYWTDPEYTSIKIISTTAGHAKSNTYSTLVRRFNDCIIKMPGECSAEYIGLDPRDKKSGIEIIAIPQGDDGKGRLQGFHPDPRPKKHPKFGTSSRIRAFLDECEEIPFGVWQGIANLLLSKEGADTIKVIGAYNPKDQSTKTAQAAEPKSGWESFDMDTGVNGKHEWESKEGWFVIQLDAKEMENVVARATIYPGFVSYEGYRDLESKNGGNSPEFYTFGRGVYPPIGVNNIIIPLGHLTHCRGDFTFIGTPINVGGVDTAVNGRDNCVFTRARCGLASSFRRHSDGKVTKFEVPRIVLQIDQQFELQKGDVKIVGNDIIRNANALAISPEYLGIDATGNGAAVWAYVDTQLPGLLGVNFSEVATETKILEEDKRTPKELYDKLVTEVWYALRYHMEFLYLALSPGLRADPLQAELTGRRYVLSKGMLVKVEEKDDYKKRLGNSPDYADSLSIALHVVRMRKALMGSMIGKKKEQPRQSLPRHGLVEQTEWVQESGGGDG